LPAVLFDFVGFFLVFFLAAIRAVYHRRHIAPHEAALAV
jgi:hypothetical protein